MIRAGALALLLGCSPALAQIAPAQPSKPTVAKPVAPKPPVAPQAKPAAPAKLPALQSELKSVDAKIAALKAKQSAQDGLSRMSEEDMRWMQQFMEQKSKLEQMISDAMKNSSDGGDSIISAPKDS